MVSEVLDDRLGSEVDVARHRERTVSVDLHARRELGPLRGRLGTEGDLQEALQHPVVIDARTHPLVVLGVTHDEPRTDRPSASWRGPTIAKSGLIGVAPGSSSRPRTGRQGA